MLRSSGEHDAGGVAEAAARRAAGSGGGCESQGALVVAAEAKRSECPIQREADPKPMRGSRRQSNEARVRTVARAESLVFTVSFGGAENKECV